VVCVTFGSVDSVCRMLVQLPPNDCISYISQWIYLLIFLTHADQCVLSPQNAVYIIVLSFLAHKIFIFYIMV